MCLQDAESLAKPVPRNAAANGEQFSDQPVHSRTCARRIDLIVKGIQVQFFTIASMGESPDTFCRAR